MEMEPEGRRNLSMIVIRGIAGLVFLLEGTLKFLRPEELGAERFAALGYQDVLTRDLKVMDASAVSLSRENKIPIIVFSIHDKGALVAVLKGEGRATVIQDRA